MGKDITPVSRIEKIIDGEAVDSKTRLEAIMGDEDLEPMTRKEHFLKKMKGGGGGGGGNAETVTLYVKWDDESPGSASVMGFKQGIPDLVPAKVTVSSILKNGTLKLFAVDGIAPIAYEMKDSSSYVTSRYSAQCVGIDSDGSILTTDGNEEAYTVTFHGTNINPQVI